MTLALLTLFYLGFGAPPSAPEVPIPPLPELDPGDPATHGRKLAEYADLFDSGWVDDVLHGTMTLFDAGGSSVQRTFTRLVYERPGDGDKVIIKFLSPAEIKGVAALTYERPGSSDDSWLYLPASRRVRRISGANNTASFQGTEFTYEDLGSIDPREYSWRFSRETTLGDGAASVPVYELEAIPTYDETGYSRLVVYLHRKEWRYERIDYYDKAGLLLKTRTADEWRRFHDRFWRAYRLEMKNHQTGKRTTIETEKLFVDLSRYPDPRTGQNRPGLTEELFTTRSIQH